MSTHCVQQQKKSTFEELLERDDSFSIHYQNIKFLAIDMFKVFKGICTRIAKEIFRESLKRQCPTN